MTIIYYKISAPLHNSIFLEVPSIDDIERCIIFGEIIEEYPDDYPYPSALICETKYGKPMHVVAGLGDDALWIITAYYPDTQKWTDDYLTRRESEI